MAKKKQKKKKYQSFSDKHPFISLVTLPVSFPFLIADDIVTEKRNEKANGRKKTKPKTKPIAVPNGTGIEYEYYVAKELKKRGFINVSVTPGSGDYGADIICYDRKMKRVCIQCKKYRGNVGV